MANGNEPVITRQQGIDPNTGLTPTGPRTGPKPPVAAGIDYQPVITRDIQLASPRLREDRYEVDPAKYEKYVPFGDVFINEGLEDARAYGQSSGEKWKNGLIKYAGKTGIITLGGTIGAIASIPGMFDENKSVYDNSTQRMFDSWMEDLDQKLPNYYTKEEQDYGFLRSLGTSNFWANDVLGAAAFTTGAILTELVWSTVTAATLGAAAGLQGASTASMVARGARYMKKFGRTADTTEALAKAGAQARLGSAGKIVRQLYTGAGYEAGFEARHHKHELVNELTAQYFQKNPDATEVPPDELVKIEEMATESANGVFAANMGIVGLSNMIGLGQIYGPKVGKQFQIASLNKLKAKTKLFSPVVKSFEETPEGLAKQIFKPAYKDHNTLEKIAGKIYTGVKNPLVEGVWEEGMQGVANNTMLDYVTKKYSVDGTDQVVRLAESFGGAMEEQYGGKAGWKEMGIGMIVGGIGSPNFRAFNKRNKGEPLWVGGVAGAFQERNDKRRRADRLSEELNKYNVEDLVKFLQDNPQHLKSTKSTVMNLIRNGYLNKEYSKAVDANNVFETKNIENDVIHSFIMSRIEGGFGADLKEELGDVIDNMSDNDFAETFGYEELGTDELQERREQAKRAFEERVDKVQNVVENVDAAYTADLSVQANRDKREALIYSASVIDNMESRENQVGKDIAGLTGVTYDPQNEDENYMKEFRDEVEKAAKNIKASNKKKLDKLMKDLPKLRRRRERYTTQYNYLLTKEGQEEFEKLLNGVSDAQVAEERTKDVKRYEGRVNLIDSTGRKFKKYVRKKDGKHVMIEVDANGDTIGDLIEIDIDNDEFRLEHEPISTEQEKVVPFNPEDSKAAVEILADIKDLETLTDFIETEIRPRNLPEHDEVLKAAQEAYKRITGRSLSYTLLTNIDYEDSAYRDKKSGRTVLVRRNKNKPNEYYVKRPKNRYNATNIETLDKEKLNEKYVFIGEWDQHEFKVSRKRNLKDLIKAKKGLLGTQKDENKKLEDEYNKLLKDYHDHIAYLEHQTGLKNKGDRRVNENSIKKTHDLINRTFQLMEAAEKKFKEGVEAQRELQLGLQYLLNRINEEKVTEDTETPATTEAEKEFFSKKADEIIEEIENNTAILVGWKRIQEHLKKVLNKLFNALNVLSPFKIKSNAELLAETERELTQDLAGELTADRTVKTTVVILEAKKHPTKQYRSRKRYKEQHVTVPSSLEDRMRVEKARQTIRTALDAKLREIEGKRKQADEKGKEYTTTSEKLNTLNEEVSVLEEIIDDHYLTLDFIDEEVQALEDYRQSKENKRGGFTTYEDMSSDESERSRDENDATSAESSDERVPMTITEAVAFWKDGLKRSIDNVFAGLSGKHVMEDDINLNPDPAQRRYYRWTAQTNIAGGEYRIQIVRPPKQERERIEKESISKKYPKGYYKADDVYYARIVDSKGRYIKMNADDSVTTTKKFNPKWNVYTSVPLKLETEIHGAKYFQPQTAEEYSLFFGKPMTKEKGDAKFEKKKKKVLKQHNEFRQKITDILKNDPTAKIYVRLNGKSLGIPNDPNANRNLQDRPGISVDEALGHENVDVAVNTLEGLALGDANISSRRTGATFVYDPTTGNVYEARPRNVNDDEISIISNIFRSFAKNSTVLEKKKKTTSRKGPRKKGDIDSTGAAKLRRANGTEYERNGLRVIEDFIFWTGNNRKRNKKTNKWYNVNKNEDTAFHFDQESDYNGGSLILGRETISIFHLEDDQITPILDKDGNLQINPSLVDENGEGALRDFLLQRSINISSQKLKSKEGFSQVVEVSPDGVVQAETIPKDEGGYVKFLIGDKHGERLVNLFLRPTGSKIDVVNEDTEIVSETDPHVYSQYAKYDNHPNDIYTDINDVPEGLGIVEVEGEEEVEEDEFEEDFEGQETAVGVTITDSPSPTYKRLGKLKVGDRIYVQYDSIGPKDKRTTETRGVLRLTEDGIFEEVDGNLSPQGIQNINNLMNRMAEANIPQKEMERAIEALNDNLTYKYQREISVADVAGDMKAKKKVKQKEAEKDTKKKKKSKQSDDVKSDVDAIAKKYKVDVEDVEGEKDTKKKKGKKNPPPDKTHYRSPSGDHLGKENIAQAEKWFRERFPKRGFGTVRRIADGKQGQLIRGAVKILMDAEVGTTYHEAFHVVTQHILSRSERRALYREWKRRNPDKANYPNGVVEEILAEEFRDFMLSKTMPDAVKSKFIEYQTPVQRTLFQKIYDSITWLVYGNQDSIAEVWGKIDQNEYRDDTDGSSFNTSDVALGRTMYNKTVSFTRDIIEGANFYFFNAIQNDVAILFDKSDNSVQIGEIYDEVYQNLIDNIGDENTEHTIIYKINQTDDPVEQERLVSVLQALDFAIENFYEAQAYDTVADRAKYSVKGLHKHYLSKFNLEALNYDDLRNENETRRDPDNNWASDVIKVSSKVSASKNVKLLLAGTTQRELITDKDGNTVEGDYKRNRMEFPKVVPFGEVFNVLANKLSGETSIEGMMSIMEDLSYQLPYMNGLIQDFSMEKDVDDLSMKDMIKQSQFVQTFGKTYHRFNIDMSGPNGKFIAFDANQNSTAEKIRQAWRNNSLGSKDLKVNKKGIVIYNNENFKGIKEIKDFRHALAFLERLGIVFTDPDEIGNYSTMKASIKNRAQAILKSIQTTKDGQIWLFDKDNDTDAREDLNVLIEIEADTTIDYLEHSHLNANGDPVYNIMDNSYYTIILDDLKRVNTYDELIALNPHLATDIDHYNRYSMILEPGGIIFDEDGVKRTALKDENGDIIDISVQPIENFIHSESKQDVTNTSRQFDELGPADQLRVQINYGLENTFPLLRPSDSTLERFIKYARPFFSRDDIDSNRHIGQMINYLTAELSRSVEDTRNDKFINSSTRKHDGIMISILYESDDLAEDLDAFFDDNTMSVEQFMESPRMKPRIEKALKEYVSERVQENKDEILRLNIIQDMRTQEEIEEGAPIEYVNNGLNVKTNPDKKDSPQLDVLTEAQVESELLFYTINDLVSNVEQTKVIFSDPINYKSTRDQFKRNYGVIGPKRIAAVYDKMNKWVEKHLTILDAKGTIRPYVRYDRFGFGKPILRTAVFNDLVVHSDNYNEYVEVLGIDAAFPYDKMNEADGQGYINMHEWRQLLFRAGMWTSGYAGSLEDLYQWEVQTRLGKTPKDLKTGRLINKDLLPVATPIKPQYMGPLAEEGFKMGMYKLSLMPLLPSVTHDFAELDKLRKTLENQEIGIAVFRTGVKTEAVAYPDADGNSEGLQNFYSDDGTFDENRTLHFQDTFYKFWGVQQEMGFKKKTRTITGSQMMKQILNGIFENGKVKDDSEGGLGRPAKKYLKLNRKRIKIGVKLLVKDLGLELVTTKKGKQKYKIHDVDRLIKTFTDEANRRDLPDNIIEGIESLKKGAKIDMLVNRERLENIILSIADSMTSSQRRFGGSPVQVSNGVGKTRRERLTEYSADGQVWKSSDLKSYTRITKKGKTVVTHMQVYLPNHMKHADLKSSDAKLFKLIGFRIPTQGLNSIEAIEIKGFLPESAGDAVMVPSDIVAKTGSDFDIDKLFMYLPNYYINSKKEPVYIEYFGDDSGRLASEYNYYKIDQEESAVRRVLGTAKAATFIGKDINRIVKEISETGATVTVENVRDALVAIRDKVPETSKQEYDIAIDVMNNMISKGENLPFLYSRDEFEKLSIENAISQVQEEIILHPDNFEQLILPISAKTLADEAAEIRKLQTHGDQAHKERVELERENVPAHKMIERKYLLDIGVQFIGATKNIGTTAIMSTFDIFCKMHNISMPSQIISNDPEVEPISTHINLPHNQTEEGKVSLSKLTDANDSKTTIPEMLSQWINASVDAMEDAFMFDLNAGRRTLSTVLYLTTAGVPLKYVSRFMNQPIIREYLENLDSWQSLMMQSNFIAGGRKRKFKDKKQVKNMTAEKYEVYLMENDVSTERLDKEMSLDDLNKDIERGAKLKFNNQPVENAMYAKRQLSVLDDFLRYMESAELIRQGTVALNYDTKAGGKNTSELMFRTERTKRFLFEEPIPGYNKIFEEEGFISPYYEAVDTFRDVFDPMFAHLNDPHIDAQFNKLFAVLLHPDNTVPEERKIKVVDRFKWEMSAFILTTQKYKLNGKAVDTTMSSQTKRLFYGKKSVAHRLVSLQKKLKKEGKEMQLIRSLEANLATKDDEISTIVMNAKRLDKIESNALTSEWNELFDRFPKFARDLAIVSMLQYGIQPSPFTFSSFMPNDVYQEMMKSAMKQLDKYEPDQRKAIFDDYYYQFFIRNYENDDIMPVQYTKGRVSEMMRIYPFYKRWVKKKRFSKIKDEVALNEAKTRGERIIQRLPLIESLHDELSEYKLGETIKDFGLRKVLTAYQTTNPVVSGKKGKNEETTNIATTETDGTVTFIADKSRGYIGRTKRNANADTTILFTVNPNSPGSVQTRKFVKAQKRVYRDVFLPTAAKFEEQGGKFTKKQVDMVVKALNFANAKTVNIAGNRMSVFATRGYTQSQIDNAVRKFMRDVLRHPDLKNKSIQIWSGGQSGADEAGTKAGQGLGKITRVIAPADWKYERVGKKGKVSIEYGKKGFTDRFNKESYAQLSNESTLPPNESLDAKIKSWLSAMGISYEQVEKIKDRDGEEIDAIAKADMLLKIVQVAEGKADITTLPEEAAHFLVEMLPADSPLLRGMMNSVVGTDTYNEVVSEYSELYNGDETRLRKEAVGKMIAKAVIQQEYAQAEKFMPWWKRAWRYLKRQLTRVTSDRIAEDLSAYVEAADILRGEKTDIPFVDIEDTGIYYQVSASEKKLAEKIKGNLREARVLRDFEHEGYKRITGEKIKNRVTDIVKKFNAKKYRKSEPGDYQLPKLKGTIVHKYLELMGQRIFEGKPVDYETIRKKVTDILTDPKDIANQEFLEKPKSFFKLAPKDFVELREGLKGIKSQVLARQKDIDPKGKVEFFPEVMIYSKTGDLAGTLDLVVVYSNGKTGIYDYKGINNLKTFQDKLFYKEDEYQVQIANYKKILVSDYGVKEFAETRIVPLDMSINKKTEAFDRLQMGALGRNNVQRPYLQQVPVDDELTDDKDLNRSLKKMMDLYRVLSAKLRVKRDDELFNRVMDLRRNITKLQIEGDVKYVAKQLISLEKDFNKRVKLPADNPNSITLDLLEEYRNYIGVYEQFGIDAANRARKSKDKKTVEFTERIAHKIGVMEGQLYQKEVELLNDENDNIDLTASAKAEGFMGRLFKQGSKFNHPAIKKFAQMMRQISDQRRKEVYEIVDDIDRKTKRLKEWAGRNGKNLQGAFDMIINKDGNLIAKFSSEFHESRKKANKNHNAAWYIANTNVVKVGAGYQYTGEKKKMFDQRRKEYIEHLNRRYPNVKKNKAEEERYNSALFSWDARYNIATNSNSALFNQSNPFIEYLDKEENFSDRYKVLFLPQNKELKDYYEMYIGYNEKFRKWTGRQIKGNFVAEIHKDVIDKMGESGLRGVAGIKDSFLRSIEMRENDTDRGTIDPVTGEPIPSIPLFYSDKLRNRLSKKEKKQIRREVENENEYKVDTDAFEEEVARRITSQEYTQGSKSKSRDLSRSLVMFADAAVSNRLLSENEASALALRDIMKSQLQETEITDGANRKVYNKYTQNIAKKIGVPLGEIEAMDQFIKMYFYGQSTQGKDIAFGKDGKYSGTKFYQNLIKYTSAKALGLKPILAMGNLLGITSNYWMMGAEGRFFNQKDMLEGIKMLTNRRDEYALAIAFFEPFIRDMVFKKANDLSAKSVVRKFTMDNLFIMHRKGDELIDAQVLMAMMNHYGIHEGKITKIEKIPSSGDSRSLMERMSTEEVEGTFDGKKEIQSKIVIDGMTNLEDQAAAERLYTDFRGRVQSVANNIKGSVPQEDRSLINATLLGQALMHFRNWMPGLVETRFKGLTYDDVHDDHDVGRFRVLVGEFTGRTVQPKLKAFMTLLGEVSLGYIPGVNFIGEKTLNMEATQRFYDRYITENKDSTLTIEEFQELRLAKLKGMAAELRIYLSFLFLVFGGKAMLPEEKDEDELGFLHKIANDLATNAFRITQRGLLEISFFFNPESVMTILKSPAPSMRVFTDLYNFLQNTWDETFDVILGEDSKYDKTDRGYYFSKLIPVWTSWADFWDIWDSWNKERGY